MIYYFSSCLSDMVFVMRKFVQRTASLHGGVVRLPFTEWTIDDDDDCNEEEYCVHLILIAFRIMKRTSLNSSDDFDFFKVIFDNDQGD